MVEGFSKHYNVHQLVWYEIHESIEYAIIREKRLKGWKRAWKLELIENMNPDWLDSGFRRNDGLHKLALMVLTPHFFLWRFYV